MPNSKLTDSKIEELEKNWWVRISEKIRNVL